MGAGMVILDVSDCASSAEMGRDIAVEHLTVTQAATTAQGQAVNNVQVLEGQ